MTKTQKSSRLKRHALHDHTRQIPLVELMCLFATESVTVRLSVLICALCGEIILSALMCLMRLIFVATLLLTTGESIKHGVLSFF